MAKNNRAPKANRFKDPEKPDGPLKLYVGRQGDGGVYQLSPKSRIRLKEAFPDGHRAGLAFVSYPWTPGFDHKDHQDFERAHKPFWPQLALILTGLTPAQLVELGGVSVYDPVAELEWPVAVLVGQG
jgi:hypothetical protein